MEWAVVMRTACPFFLFLERVAPSWSRFLCLSTDSLLQAHRQFSSAGDAARIFANLDPGFEISATLTRKPFPFLQTPRGPQ
ncbi:MAG: hypothetical protein A2940_01180 [Candidatus Wildermuthbacteria bacterium RIFCSPLOWO2_01_FULL_48_29]|uniref:Uncharacterized protein n=1 Tax=Candidatus Wildermuthbacteria bacterium RIFCSPLOWO2_01_FULL_48_29 TaxID=1802462 RepID=A0A1G2RMR9_9BACT|nr:MAG: hypothetical protein A2940_01180 [Candidatus Wildermuthbacteria bacterium RIFCSPLOWO2_01_FULL_48_29]